MNKKEPVNKKYGFTGKTCRFEGHNLRQIYAVSAFGDIKKNQVGGWIQNPNNLSAEGLCWVHPDGMVSQHAVIKDDAQVYNGIVHDSAIVEGQAVIGHCQFNHQFPRVFGNAHIMDKARICDTCSVSGFAIVRDKASVQDWAVIRDKAVIKDCASAFHHAIVFGAAHIQDHAFACCYSMVGGNTVLYGYCCVSAHTTLIGDGAYEDVYNKKYMIDWDDYIEKDGRTLYRIIAMDDGGYFHNGQKGGYIESERNLSHAGHAWIQEGAYAYGDTVIQGDNVLRPIDCE